MRLIWSSPDLDAVRSFSILLHNAGIEFTIDEDMSRDWSSDEYGSRQYLMWIHDEDTMEHAKEILENFLQNPEPTPSQPTENTTQPHFIRRQDPRLLLMKYLEKKLHFEQQKKLKESLLHNVSRPKTIITLSLIALCTLIFFMQTFGEKESAHIPVPVKNILLTTNPIRKALLYDYPQPYELLDKIVTSYGPEVLLKPQEMPTAAKFLFEQTKTDTLWLGIYPQLVNMGHRAYTGQTLYPYDIHKTKRFEKIEQGEFWRIATPILLHDNLLHLFFNMVWLLILGAQVETRVREVRFIALIIIIACISNTCQYLMSGPNFLGFSGVACGLATFIRTRQIKAPWEGYLMTTSTYNFIIYFIGILAGLSLVDLFFQIFQGTQFPIPVANTAHLTGAVSGFILGRLNIFSWQPQKK